MVRSSRALLMLVLVTLITSCGEPAEPPGSVSDEASDPEAPRYPGSEPISGFVEKDKEPYCGGNLDNCCEVTITPRGTNDSVEEVVSFYKSLGFSGEGYRANPLTFQPDPEGSVLRWQGTRDGTPKSWRRVDIGIGRVFAVDEWDTVVEVHAPRCGPIPAPTATS
jgi:hypothetical protein